MPSGHGEQPKITSTEPEDVPEPEEESKEPDESEPLLLSFTGGPEEELLGCGFEPLEESSMLLEDPLNPEEFSGPLEESPELPLEESPELPESQAPE